MFKPPVISRTEVLLILDRSGSMANEGASLEAIGGVNRFLQEQRRVPEEAYFSILRFDDVVERVWDRKPKDAVKDLTEEDLIPRGGTALFDAIGDGVTSLLNRRKGMQSHEIPNRTIVVIVSDGHDNMSGHFEQADIADLIARVRKLNWRLLFFCSNLGGIVQAQEMGFRPEEVQHYQTALELGQQAFGKASEDTAAYRLTGGN